MQTIGFYELKEHDKDNITVWRKVGDEEYALKGILEYHVIEGRDLFMVDAEEDGCFLKGGGGDIVRFRWKKYQVDLPE